MPRGRPKGSKNKITLADEALKIKKNNTLLVNLFGNVKEVKKEIRRLRKIKLACRSGSTERLNLEHSIKELKKQLKDNSVIEPDKEKLIKQILIKDSLLSKLEIDLNKFSIAELEKHLLLITKRGEK